MLSRPDGGVLLADGTIVLPDGTVVPPGARLAPTALGLGAPPPPPLATGYPGLPDLSRLDLNQLGLGAVSPELLAAYMMSLGLGLPAATATPTEAVASGAVSMAPQHTVNNPYGAGQLSFVPPTAPEPVGVGLVYPGSQAMHSSHPPPPQPPPPHPSPSPALRYDFSATAGTESGGLPTRQPTGPEDIRRRLQQYGRLTGWEDDFVRCIQECRYRTQRSDLLDSLASDDVLCDAADGWQAMQALRAGHAPAPLGLSRELLATLGVDAAALRGPSPLGPAPDQRLKRHLQQTNKKAYYEYCALFREENLMEYRAEQDLPKVLFVAEKPSVARSIAEFLSNGRMRTRRTVAKMCPVHEFFGRLGSERVQCRVTSVVGHLFGLDFADNRRRDEATLFDAETVKRIEEGTQKCRIVEHLREEAEGCSYLSLWLDCDREGENICFEVISVLRETFKDESHILRAKFSAITAPEIQGAWRSMGPPNVNLSLAVDARQELDLKIGVAFTRYLTRYFRTMAQEKFDPELRLLSYGPCQSPTLWFCIQRYDEMCRFQPAPFWSITVGLDSGARDPLEVQWARERCFGEAEAHAAMDAVRRAAGAYVVDVETKQLELHRPQGMNTVQLLKTCSTGLGMGPGKAMKVAENLYTSGYLSYPRTETTKYPATFNVTEVLEEHSRHPAWGKTAQWVLRQHGGRVAPPPGGKDVGDHPPITPTKYATREDFTKNSEWRLYETVVRHFIASFMPNMTYTETVAQVAIGEEAFKFTTHAVVDRGFTFIQTWRYKDLHLNDEEGLGYPPPRLCQGQTFRIVNGQLLRAYTEAPSYLKESELIALMDQNGIGTDASIPQHIQNICERQYVVIPGAEAGKFWKGGRQQKGKGGKGKGGAGAGEQRVVRHMVPTKLGLAIIDGFRCIDEEIVHPTIRSGIEREVARIAMGEATKTDVVSNCTRLYQAKFNAFRQQIGAMERFFKGPSLYSGYARKAAPGGGPADLPRFPNPDPVPVTSFGPGLARPPADRYEEE
eukprot:EG_transcript_1807